MTVERAYWDEDFGVVALHLASEDKETNTARYVLTFTAKHEFVYPLKTMDTLALQPLNDTAIATYLERCADDLKRVAQRVAQGDYNGQPRPQHPHPDTFR